MSVTVVSCVYGGYQRFVGEWDHAVRQLDPRPEAALIVADRAVESQAAQVFVAPHCDWRHPQAFYLQQAFELAMTEWVWIADIDDQVLPDALDGIDQVAADVWMMGYLRSDGELYLPPPTTAEEVLASAGNAIPGTSAIRADAFRRAGGFPDVAFQDWGLWRRLAACGATFEPSGRVHFRYQRHPHTRSETELTPELRARHLAEMMESEGVLVG